MSLFYALRRNLLSLWMPLCACVFLLSLIALSTGCGDQQVVVIKLSNLYDLTGPNPTKAQLSGLGVYYHVDSVNDKKGTGGLKPDKNGNALNYELFGIALDKNITGTLVVDVYLHKDSLLCIRGKGHVDVALTGAPKQEVEMQLSPLSPDGCDTSFMGTSLPKNPKIWGAALDDLWIVGDGGSILRWNGAFFEKVTLPDSLLMDPLHPRLPNFRSVHGSESNNVWIVGDEGTILQWDGDKLFYFRDFIYKPGAKILPEAQVKLEINDVWIDSGTRDVGLTAWDDTAKTMYFGYANIHDRVVQFVNPKEEAGAFKDEPSRMAFMPQRPLSVACARRGDCWVVGERGMIIVRQGSEPLKGYMDYTSSSASWPKQFPTLRAVNVFSMGNIEEYALAGVGDSSAFFFGNRFMGSEAAPAFPAFTRPPFPEMMFTAVAQRESLVAIVNGAGGYLAQIGSLVKNNVAQQPLNTKDDISDVLLVNNQILSLTTTGQFFLSDIPKVNP